nr:insulinase family protein [Anaerolineae bacterium]
SLEFGSGGHTYWFAGKSLAEDLPILLNLSAEILREPIFSAEHVERVRGQILTSLQLRAHNTGKMANLTFHELAYPEDHPYAFSVSGYEDTVSGIRREDIIAFHNNLGPRGAIIVVVGAVKAEQAVEQVRAAFQSWSVDDQPPFPVAPPAPRLKSIREAYVPIPGKSQVDIVMGFPGPERSAPSYHAARIANSILGVFGMYGRLGEIVRRQQGLAYYSYSNLVGGFGPGPWQLIAGVAPDSVDRVVSSFRDEIRRLVDEPVAGEELADNKAFFIGQLVLGLETNEGVASVLMTIEKHQLGLDYLYGYADMINALTVQDVQNVAATYLDPDAYALAIAGSV